MGTTRIKYSSETRKLRVYYPYSPEPNFWEDVEVVRFFGEKAFFLQIWKEELMERIQKLFSGEISPNSPYQIQEIAFLLRRLRTLQSVLVLDLPGWRNPRENSRAEWLAALRELDASLAQKVRQFISGEGKREYLKQNSRD